MDPVKHLNPSPLPGPAGAHTVAPDPSLYAYVLRRPDRKATIALRIMVHYSREQAISRCITTPWDGLTQATLFLRDQSERTVAWRLGWRDDITAQWRSSLEQPVPIEPEPEPVTYEGQRVNSTWLQRAKLDDMRALGASLEVAPPVDDTRMGWRVAISELLGI